MTGQPLTRPLQPIDNANNPADRGAPCLDGFNRLDDGLAGRERMAQ